MSKCIGFIISIVFFFSLSYAGPEFSFYSYSGMYLGADLIQPAEGPATMETSWNQSLVPTLGAKIKSGSNLEGMVELGFSPTADRVVNLRHSFGKWNINEKLYLLLGQTNTPVLFIKGSQQWMDWNSLLGYGSGYVGRRGQVQIGVYGLKISFINPLEAVDGSKPYLSSTAPVASWKKDKKKVAAFKPDENAKTKIKLYDNLMLNQSVVAQLPKVEASYTLKLENFSAKAAGGIQLYSNELTYKKDSASTDTLTRKCNIAALVFGADAEIKLGKLKATAAFMFAKNPYTYGVLLNGSHSDETILKFNLDDEILLNSTSLMIPVVISYAINDKATFEVGYGIERVMSGMENAIQYTSSSGYANIIYNIAEGVSIAPEVGFADNGKNPADRGETNLDKIVYGALNLGISF